MASNDSNVTGLKRKLVGCDSESANKAPRAGMEHGPSTHACHCCPAQQQRGLTDQCFNYLKSGLPRRVMFYKTGDWLDFPESVSQTLIEGFRDRRSSNEVEMGGQLFLVDFLSMVMINLRTRKQCSVAWIDEADRCFFPISFVGDVVDDSGDSGSVVMGSNLQRPELRRASGSQPEVVKHVVEETRAPVLPQLPTADILRTMIEHLDRKSERFLSVQNIFLSGMGPFATPSNILHIYRYAPRDMAAQIRLQAFQKQIELTEAARGASNAKNGWFGSSKLDIIEILIHGFGNAGKPTEGGIFGSGLYLSPENRSFASVNLCDGDEKGIRYMLLCRAILGNAEQVQPGSNLCAPSSVNYDSAVDNIVSPNCYLIWPSHMNTYIHPEYLVTFKLAPRFHEYLSELKDMRFHVLPSRAVPDFNILHTLKVDPAKGPTSPWMSFASLFAEIQDKISPIARELLYLHYEELKAKKLTREEMVKKMTIIVGQSLLVTALQKLKRSPASWYGHPSTEKMKADVTPALPTFQNASAMPLAEKNESASPMEPNEASMAAAKSEPDNSAATPMNSNGVAI